MSAVGGGGPTPYDVGWFDDADELRVEPDPVAEVTRSRMIGTLIRADLSGVNPGATRRLIDSTKPGDREDLAFAMTDALNDPDMRAWVEASPARRKQVEELVLAAAPPAPSVKENADVDRAVAAFRDWGRYPHDVIIVPGYTPLDATAPQPGVHPVGKERLEQAVRDFRSGKAPFILVSGGNVYPRGTSVYEALEMKRELRRMGVPADRIIVDARARHSTTNLRNAGRYMQAHGLTRGLITTTGGGPPGFDQDFYFSSPHLSTFHARSERDLGYRVGELRQGDDMHTYFTPSAEVCRVNYRDVLDP